MGRFTPSEVETIETQEMGRVVVEAHVANLKDAWEVERGLREPDDARTVSIEDALVDTGATSCHSPLAAFRHWGSKK